MGVRTGWKFLSLYDGHMAYVRYMNILDPACFVIMITLQTSSGTFFFIFSFYLCVETSLDERRSLIKE